MSCLMLAYACDHLSKILPSTLYLVRKFRNVWNSKSFLPRIYFFSNFRTKKAPSRNYDTWSIFRAEIFKNWMVRFFDSNWSAYHMQHIPSCDDNIFRCLFEISQDPPQLKFSFKAKKNLKSNHTYLVQTMQMIQI